MFDAWTWNSAWQLLNSSFSITNIVGGGAVAIAILLPKQLDFITDLRKWAIVVAVCAFGYSGVFVKGMNHGLSVKQAEWNAAVSVESTKGEKARSDAVDAIGPVSADRSVLRSDPRNRDKRRTKPAG